MIGGGDIWLGIVERLGYGRLSPRSELRLSIRAGDETHVFLMDLGTARKLARRIQFYVKAAGQ